MKEFYSKENSQYYQQNQHWHVPDSAWKAKQINKMIQRNHLTSKRIAEIGCGAGEILVQLQQLLADKTIQFYGYDIAPDASKFWESRKNENLHFFLEDLNQKSELIFDLLLVIDVFEHVENYLQFIRDASTHAQHKIFHIPLDINILGLVRNMPIYLRKHVGHLHYFTKDTALESLKDCGLEIIDWMYTPGSLELNNKRLRSKVMNIPRSVLYAINKDWAVKILGGYSLLVLAR